MKIILLSTQLFANAATATLDIDFGADTFSNSIGNTVNGTYNVTSSQVLY